MPVNGPTGPGPKPAPQPPTTSTTPAVERLDPAPTTSPVLDTQDDSTRPAWQSRTGRYRPPDEINGQPLTADAELSQALDLYQQRLDSILVGNAMTLARGGSAIPDGSLTDAQKSDLVRATEDLLRDVPIGKLSPGFAANVQEELAKDGIQRDLSTTRLGDLGSVGGDLAKRWANNMRESSPAEFYALGAGAAAAAGYAAWDKGSAGLRSLGIRPEVKSQLFDPRFTVRGGVDFDPHFKNVTGRVQADYSTPSFNLSAMADIDRSGRISAFSTGASYVNGNLGASVQATEHGGKLDAASATLLYNTPTFALSAGALYQNHTVSGGVEAEYRPNKNTDWALSASRNAQGETWVGIGFRESF